MKKCFLCGKKVTSGFSVSPSHKKTKRVFKPNLIEKTLTFEGKKKRVKICTRCLKSLEKRKTPL